MRILLATIVLFGFIPSLAHAACSSPAGGEGKVIYNADHKFVQFCNGTDWVAMSGAGTVDDLGDHTATQNLNMGAHAMTSSAGTIRDANGGWVRTYGSTGWYNGTHGGGWYMSDGTWIRSYGSKNVYVDTIVRADGGFQVDGVSAISGTGQLNADSQRITNVASPSASTDAANKAYVDANAGGGSLQYTTATGNNCGGQGTVACIRIN